jgi:hypothetical protein
VHSLYNVSTPTEGVHIYMHVIHNSHLNATDPTATCETVMGLCLSLPPVTCKTRTWLYYAYNIMASAHTQSEAHTLNCHCFPHTFPFTLAVYKRTLREAIVTLPKEQGRVRTQTPKMQRRIQVPETQYPPAIMVRTAGFDVN